MRRLEDLERRHSEQLQTFIVDAEQKQSLVERKVKKQVETVTNKAESERVQREEYFKNALIEARRGFDEQIEAQRYQQQQEKQVLVGRFREQLAKSENANSDRLDRKVSFYERQIEDTNDRHLRELRSTEVKYKRLFEQEQRSSEMEKNMLKGQYESKLADIQQASREEIDRLNLSLIHI